MYDLTLYKDNTHKLKNFREYTGDVLVQPTHYVLSKAQFYKTFYSR
jgi:hypothetical protein